MRSIPGAMIWETFSNGRWNLLAGLLGANALPVLIMTALQHQGGIDHSDQAYIIMHLMLAQISMFAFSASVLSAQGNLSRLYAWPIPTGMLVLWHMLPAMLLVWLQTVLSTLAMNAWFGLDWPYWGQALFFAALIASVQAALWQTDKTAWLVLALGSVTTFMGLWLKSRHGPLFSQPTQLWTHLTPWEVLFLLAVIVISYLCAVQGVARSRRGDILKPLGIVAWFQRVFDPPQYSGPAFASPRAAQSWYEWRLKGPAMPGAVVFSIAMGLFGWLILSRDPKELYPGFVAGGGLLSLLAMIIGLLIGNAGPTDSKFMMGHFLATRPMTNREHARTILCVASKTVLWAWLAWAVSFLITYLFLIAFNVHLQSIFPSKVGWWYFPVTLIGPWVVVMSVAAICLIGRETLFVRLICTFLACFFVGIPVTEYGMTREQAEQLFLGLTVAFGIAFVLLTAWSMSLALRKKLIDPRTVCLLSAAWVLTSGGVIAMGLVNRSGPFPIYIFATGGLSLAIAPFATTPLALGWNRTR